MRQATETDLQKIRELLAAAGGPRELSRWIKTVPQKRRPRGRPPSDKWYTIDFFLLEEINQRHQDACWCRPVSVVISEVVAEKWQAQIARGGDPSSSLGA